MHSLDVQVADGGIWKVNYNGDFSGDIVITRPEYPPCSVPMEVLEAIIAEKVRGQLMREVEDADVADLLYAGRGRAE